MKAIILAAGLGTRLMPLTSTLPKALIPFRGMPMLERVIRNLEAAGIVDIIVNVHHFADQVEIFLKELDIWGADKLLRGSFNQVLKSNKFPNDKLSKLVLRFRIGAKQLGLKLPDSPAAIQPVIIGDSQRTVELGQKLLKQGIWVGAIRPPTVAQGSARLRITFSALHEEQHVDLLLEALAALSI